MDLRTGPNYPGTGSAIGQHAGYAVEVGVAVEGDQRGAAPAGDDARDTGVHAHRVQATPELRGDRGVVGQQAGRGPRDRPAAGEHQDGALPPGSTTQRVADPRGERGERLGVLRVVLPARPAVGGCLEPLLELRLAGPS